MSFRFKQFIVNDDRCAMKVGTDGVLLGAWTPLTTNDQRPTTILDIGTGSGLIALMLAQRCPPAHIDAIDIDPDAVSQAADNFAASPWSDRLHAQCTALQKYQISNIKYQIITSNPPYFVDSLKNPDKLRQTARHTDTLSYSDLLSGAARLLADNGTFAVILPADAETTFLALAEEHELFPAQLTYVHPTPAKQPKRILIALKKHVTDCSVTHFNISSLDSPRSPEYQALTADFYL